ncbi:MAG: hypothetical protein IT381_05785 [Deltaproteobacteria bacterium]|nr:hypothetical protein [Deltaproteobacteria bacterium]
MAKRADDDDDEQAIAVEEARARPDRVDPEGAVELVHRIDDELKHHDVPSQLMAPGAFRVPIFASMRARFAMDDQVFDSLYPYWVRMLSDTHWTPVSVAVRAAQLLLPGAGEHVIDIGSGTGKFCTIAGMLHHSAIFYGVEQRLRLIHVAEKLGRRLGVDNTRYLHTDIASVNLDDFEAAYMFNPFGEHVLDGRPQIDGFHRPSHRRYRDLIAVAQEKLARARPGFRVVTYHGFGGEMPRSYERMAREPSWSDYLELWVKRV